MVMIKDLDILKEAFYNEGVRLAEERGFISLEEITNHFPDVDQTTEHFIVFMGELCKGFDSVPKK
ncbi:hypothetical protein GV828_00580 [Flavobacterium sp. NST-5]|uniref:Uncharacterized protein n=1 Tax=Flavobacterium ichthyis TaxID=2698827 RepID=A0ABW9ZA62_9FLAO|nr:hypothetical protein [Flavobacterium ichthyis]NBL63688.1 hypothetical protein [Flavobacterium ichthyis]